MKTQEITLKATLTSQTCLRIFYVNYGSDVRYDIFGLEDYFEDIPLSGKEQWTHEALMKKILIGHKVYKRKKLPLDKYCPLLRSKQNQEAVYAYQIFKITKILDQRERFGHQDTETERSIPIGKRVFLFGDKVSRSKIKKLTEWLKNEDAKDSSERKDSAFDKRRVSMNALGHFNRTLRKNRTSVFLKLGPATLFPWDPKTMELLPFKG